MKRSFPACLPVPIFNQKKRNRQPLTSVPHKNDPSSGGINLGYESFGFSSMATDSVCGNSISQMNNAGKKLDSSLQVSHPVPHPMAKQYRPNVTNLSTDKKTNIWPEGENVFYTHSKDLSSGPKRYYGPMQMWENLKGPAINEKYVPQVHPQIQLSKHTSMPSNTWSHYSCASPSGKRDHMASYSFKSNAILNKDNAFADMPEEEMVQAIPLYQMTFKEKSNSLRIIPVSIERMKYWSQYTDRTPLLFELLGDHGSKLFLIRDGKNIVPCIFFEIDRDLPRLIRGRVLRTMGNYDKKRNIFKCVSVRPASVAEQQTFMKFITAAEKEMEMYVKLE
ncbi:spermatogenesis-associated protein 22 isoform X2 [Mixophyes fleayi]|uniref:spermatogenesis-associated protein 22 isoform X2 n=1 Tax=Mixophyes fleayi TaxID=3061075 RepID=UPI003F4D7872